MPHPKDVLTVAGKVGFVLGLGALVQFGLALSQGIHCPECDRLELGDHFAAWVTYFRVRDALIIGAGLASLPAVAYARRRRWGLGGLALFLAQTVLYPM